MKGLWGHARVVGRSERAIGEEGLSGGLFLQKSDHRVGEQLARKLPAGMDLLFGEGAGRIEVLDEPTGAWTLWPRVAQLGQDGSWKIVPDQSYTLVDHVHTNPVPFPLLKRLEAGSDIGRELMRIREEMRAAGVAFVRELRPILWRIDGLVQALPPGDALWRAARALQEDILKAMSAEKPLGGFRRQ